MKVLLQSGDSAVNEAYNLFLKFNQDEEFRQFADYAYDCDSIEEFCKALK